MAVEASTWPLAGAEGAAVTAEAYERIALGASDATWELWDGRLREKPGVSVAHGRAISRLARQLLLQIDEDAFEVRINTGRLRRAERSYYVPDLFVVAELDVAGIEVRPDSLEAYRTPMALVVEIWSPSTGAYDVESKLPEDQRRGDIEVWRLHPYERTLTVWRRGADGSHGRAVLKGGTIEPIALAGVRIDLDALFA